MSSKALLFAGVVLSVSLPAFADSGVEFVAAKSQATQAEREAAHRLHGPDHALES